MDASRLTRRTALAAVAGGALSLRARPARAATVLRWATVLTASHPGVAMMDKVAADVREKTSGEIDIQTFPSGQLGSSRDVIEATSTGAIQMVDEGAAQFGQFVAPFSILEAPYIWKDPAHMRRALSAPLMDDMNAQLAGKRNMRVVGSTYYGTRHVTSGSRAVHNVGEMAGFKLRIPEVDTYRAMAEAWGARPTPLNFGELYLALSQGAVDGEENPLPTIHSSKFYEVQKFLVRTAHIMSPRLIAINEGTWKAIPDKHKEVLRASLARFGREQDEEIVRQETGLTNTFRDAGMTVIEPDLDSFRKPVLASLPAKFEAKWGRGLWDKVASA
ncbi:DctP family TRAP transporter solute-binding subunit [Bradyrhizobium sp. WD16]|uniref:DctP family TRAP transporter solute-binding subunit n=1 Tax=Bradyrhizobium sp. WD16 TaxID=1521768 RepID=UPI0020A30E65|nr:DctP family TRAP transporter solute-binding subunit [Bradyrhizobium sp. WD16]UTD28966.1 TRAP transporter substrate-binding protein DctP [Bradyrhizobium sp. WD16]